MTSERTELQKLGERLIRLFTPLPQQVDLDWRTRAKINLFGGFSLGLRPLIKPSTLLSLFTGRNMKADGEDNLYIKDKNRRLFWGIATSIPATINGITHFIAGVFGAPDRFLARNTPSLSWDMGFGNAALFTTIGLARLLTYPVHFATALPAAFTDIVNSVAFINTLEKMNAQAKASAPKKFQPEMQAVNRTYNPTSTVTPKPRVSSGVSGDNFYDIFDILKHYEEPHRDRVPLLSDTDHNADSLPASPKTMHH